MKNWKAVLAAVLAGLMVYGCKGTPSDKAAFEPAVSSIYVAKDGTVSSATVENCDKDYYKQEALQEYVMSEVAAYNQSLGSAAVAHNIEGADAVPVAVTSCTIKDGKAVVIYQYLDGSVFQAFAEEYHDEANQTKAFGTDTVSGGRAKGWLTDGDFVKPGKGTETSDAGQEELDKLSEERIVMVETDHPVTIQTEGKVLYMTRGVTLTGSSTAQAPEGLHYLIFK